MELFNRVYFEADKDAPGGDADNKAADKSGRTFSQDEVNAIVLKAVEKETAKVLQKSEQKLNEIREAEKLKGMTEAERIQHENDTLKGKLKEYETAQLKNQVKLTLSEKGLPGDIADYLHVDDAEKAKSAIDFLSGYVAKEKEPLQAKITELEAKLNAANLRGAPPKAAIQPNQPDSVMSDIFKKLKGD